jgi:hypothetical protein
MVAHLDAKNTDRDDVVGYITGTKGRVLEETAL